MSITKHLTKKEIASLKEQGMTDNSEIEVLDVPIELVVPNNWNPNVQSDTTFNELVYDIEKDGFDEPLQVVVVKDDAGKFQHFRIIGGEHRFKALQVLGKSTVPVVVKDWDSETVQKIKTVRRNVLTGELDEKKFTLLFNEILEKEQKDREELAREFGFVDNFKEFEKVYKDDRGRYNEKFAEEMIDSKTELQTMENLSFILNKLFGEYGETVSMNYMFLFYGTKLHLMIRMNREMQRQITAMTKYCLDHNVNIVDVFTGLLKEWHTKVSLPVVPESNYFEEMSDLNKFESEEARKQSEKFVDPEEEERV